MQIDNDCICYGNWRRIVKECENLIGRQYKHKEKLYTFFGIVFGEDDYYYGMTNDGRLELLSCVGSLENYGFELVDK